ncbi:T9SS type A sorting domain-containing protein [bacterium]|nr:T9SS type A sorting domain-containing protein [bacterium]
MKKLLTLFCGIFLLAAVAGAQPGDCTIDPGEYRTQTQGGWGNNCNGGNPGCIRDAWFPSVFPAGLTIGGGFTIHFTSANAVRTFLPAGSTPGVLTQNYTDPSSTSAGVFAGQVTALSISVGFGLAGVPGFGDFSWLEVGAGPFTGYTVAEILTMANAVLGGNLGALPPGKSVSDLNEVVDNINQNFVDGTTNQGVLVIPPDCEVTQPCPPMPPTWVEIGSTFCLEYCGTPIEVYWCCPLDGQPVFVLDHCPGALMPAGLTWVASYDSTGLECQAPGGYWHAIFEAEEDGCFCVFFERQLAVEMLSFTAGATNGAIQLAWATATENGNDHFEIFRNGSQVAEIAGAGVSETRTNYSWTDRDVIAGVTYSYELFTEDLNGIRRSHGTRTVEAGLNNSALITEYALHQNYPNPFNPSTSIQFDVPEAAQVTLSISNALGATVATLVNGRVEAGSHTVQFDAAGLPTGIYFYVLRSGSFSSTQKMLLLK